MDLNVILAVGLGGGIGATARLLLASVTPPFIFSHFPIQIIIVNVLGCLFMGALVELMAFYGSVPHVIRSFLVTGFLGGFTTFSAFSLEFALLTQKNMYGLAILYAVTSVGLSLGCFFLGAKMIRLTVTI